MYEEDHAALDWAIATANPHHQDIAENALVRGHHDPSQCHCNGSGWWLTNFDTWETCGRHYRGQEHPEYVGCYGCFATDIEQGVASGCESCIEALRLADEDDDDDEPVEVERDDDLWF